MSQDISILKIPIQLSFRLRIPPERSKPWFVPYRISGTATSAGLLPEKVSMNRKSAVWMVCFSGIVKCVPGQ